MKIAAAFLLIALCAPAQRKPGSPLDHLPANIEILTHFGERADIAPDNAHVAFMSKSFGDAFTIDLETRAIRCLTCNVPGAAFLRVMHLATGDYILIGPEKFTDIHTSRARDNELWFLSKERGAKPFRLDEKMSEGAAISKKNLRIAYAQTRAQHPEFAEGYSRLVTAEVEIGGNKAALRNKKVVYESKSRDCVIEAQDFYDNDTKLTFSCYEPGDKASVMGIDLATGEVTNFSKAPGTYNEPEGIFPDGKYTCVEADRQIAQLGGEGGHGQIDIWKLRLDGTGKDFVRLTHFNDYDGWKASNPVVAADGRFMAFQVARAADPAGVGYGILLFRFRK